MYIAGQIISIIAAGYLGNQAAKHNPWILLATIILIIGVAMSIFGLK